MKLKLFSIFFLLFFLERNSFGQARIVFGATATYMVMSSNATRGGNPIYLVVGDATANAATNTIARTNGGIIGEGENNIVKWYIGTGIGTYTVPWQYSTTDYLPLSFTTAGSPAGGKYINFSTYKTSNYQNSLNLPLTGTVPTNYYSSAIPGVADTYGADRFWSLDADAAYTTKPDLNNLTFYYSPNEINGSNTNITPETDLQAQRWSTTGSGWGGWINGVDNNVSHSVQLSITAADFFKWWTLVDKSKPLPVTWLDLSAECESGNMIIKWSTASEENSDFFTVEKSLDGINFETAVTIKAAGNSSTTKNYSIVDHDVYSGTSFYRIKETDFNGEYSYSNMITVTGCNSDNITIYGSDGGATISINAMEDGQYNIEMYDLIGKKVLNETKNVAVGSNHIKLTPNDVASAIYVVKVYNNHNAVAKKVFIRSSNVQ